MAELPIGTSAFTATGWPGSFYPKGMRPRDFLTYYATKFDSVEAGSTIASAFTSAASQYLFMRTITMPAMHLPRSRNF